MRLGPLDVGLVGAWLAVPDREGSGARFAAFEARPFLRTPAESETALVVLAGAGSLRLERNSLGEIVTVISSEITPVFGLGLSWRVRLPLLSLGAQATVCRWMVNDAVETDWNRPVRRTTGRTAAHLFSFGVTVGY